MANLHVDTVTLWGRDFQPNDTVCKQTHDIITYHIINTVLASSRKPYTPINGCDTS